MSIMNDALRKKSQEKKHPSGPEIFQKDFGQTPLNRVRTYGIGALVLLVCAAAGFYLYEMMSLSQPVAPVLPSPRRVEPHPNPHGEMVPARQDNGMPALTEATPSVDRLPEMQAEPAKTETRKPTASAPEPADQQAAVPLNIVLPPLSEKTQKASQPEKSVPPPLIEPDEINPQAESAGNTNPTGSGDMVAIADTRTAPVAEELFYRKGLSYHRQNKLEMAIQMYQAVLKKNPDHRPTRFNLAAAYIQVGAFTEARTLLAQLHRQAPENPEILLNLAVVEIGLDRPAQALLFLEDAEKAFAAPTFEILFHKGVAHSRMGDFETALAMYRKAEKLAPDNPRLQLNTAIVFDRLRAYNQAIDRYQIFLDRNPAIPMAERREIETRLRELTVYLTRKANPQAASGQAE